MKLTQKITLLVIIIMISGMLNAMEETSNTIQ